MKVISITEPYASLIKEQKKLIETRSWKTNYRGEIYIHASVKKINTKYKRNQELLSLINNQKLNFGYIICKCNLIDCVYMTESYIEKLKKENYQEYICGDYQVGRYAWILDNIEPLDKPIKAKGQLGIWNYYTKLEVMTLMKSIEYGYVDKNDCKHVNIEEDFANKYKLQSPQELIKSHLGVCWDQVELERYYFKNYFYPIKTYFIINQDGNKCPTHTFLTIEKNNKYYWFEHAWEKYQGIHEYRTLKALLNDIKDKFINDLEEKEEINILLFEYKKPKSGLNVEDYCKYTMNSKQIEME